MNTTTTLRRRFAIGILAGMLTLTTLGAGTVGAAGRNDREDSTMVLNTMQSAPAAAAISPVYSITPAQGDNMNAADER